MSIMPVIAPALGGRAPSSRRFVSDVLAGLHRRHKEIPCKYFYDDAGSELFERITKLDEYYLTRAELEIMRRSAGEMAGLIGSDCVLIEYGSGSSSKTRFLLDHLEDPVAYLPVDISGKHLRRSARALARDYPDLFVHPLCLDFTRPIKLSPREPLAGRRAVYFPGSTIGNLVPAEALGLLRQTARLVGSGGALLLGVDLRKDPSILHAAYNDREGVTAAFNLNLLERINRELGADFRVENFWHHAYYNVREGRIEMHLISRCDQCVHIGPEEISLPEGESIRTELSYKYTRQGLRQMAALAGYEVEQVWTDANEFFTVQYWVVR